MAEMIKVERKKLEELLVHMMRTANCKHDTVYIENFHAILNPTPTMTTEDWQRVIDEEFYVITPRASDLPILPHNQPISASQLVNSDWEVLRRVGHRQPHFKGHPHPEGNTVVIVKDLYSSPYDTIYANSLNNWDDVREYIVL